MNSAGILVLLHGMPVASIASIMQAFTRKAHAQKLCYVSLDYGPVALLFALHMRSPYTTVYTAFMSNMECKISGRPHIVDEH